MKFIELQLKGIDDTASYERRGGYVHVYGVRPTDAAQRVLGVALAAKDAAEIMQEAAYVGKMPTIEVPDNCWFYAAVLGPSRFEKGSEPQ